MIEYLAVVIYHIMDEIPCTQILTYVPLDKMDAISQTTCSNAFSLSENIWI